MQESTKNKKTESADNKKDYYTPVMICQIVTAVLLFFIYLLIISPSESVKSEFLTHINSKMWETYEIIETVRDYFTSEGTWQVFGNNVTYAEENEEVTKLAEDTTAADFSGTGGDDLTAYEAAENTSFAAIRTTTPAVHPIENGRYTSLFGYRINPITGEFSFHTGIDIAAAEGTKIRAAYSGVVTKAGEDGRAGKYIFLTHDDGFVTFYCHCSEILAEEGAVIRQGETIAKVGSTGWSTGPHLHFEIRKNNIRYNPIFILENDS